MPAHSEILRTSELTATVGDNVADGEHAAGYNGIWRLVHRSEPASLFVPRYAGFNLEHILRGKAPRGEEEFFEPRRAPMELRRLDEMTVELHQPPTPIARIESWTRFRFVEPDGIDFFFRALPAEGRFPSGFVDFFWASYIHAPEDKSIYFLGSNACDQPREDPVWVQYCTQAHGRDSTVCRQGRFTPLPGDKHASGGLMDSLSPAGWMEPFFYGRFGKMVLLVMFELDERLRFSHSPTGGGLSPGERTTNPAWDFQFIAPGPRVGEEIGFRAKILYRPQMTRAEVLKEYAHFRGAQ